MQEMLGQGRAEREAQGAEEDELGLHEGGAEGVVGSARGVGGLVGWRGTRVRSPGGGGFDVVVVEEAVGREDDVAEAAGGFGGFGGEGDGGEVEGLWLNYRVCWLRGLM